MRCHEKSSGSSTSSSRMKWLSRHLVQEARRRFRCTVHYFPAASGSTQQCNVYNAEQCCTAKLAVVQSSFRDRQTDITAAPSTHVEEPLSGIMQRHLSLISYAVMQAPITSATSAEKLLMLPSEIKCSRITTSCIEYPGPGAQLTKQFGNGNGPSPTS